MGITTDNGDQLLTNPHLHDRLTTWEFAVAVLIGLDLPFCPLKFNSPSRGPFTMDDPYLYELIDWAYPSMRGALIGVGPMTWEKILSRLMIGDLDGKWLRKLCLMRCQQNQKEEVYGACRL